MGQSIVDSRWKRFVRPLLLGLCLLQSVSYTYASQDLTEIKSLAEKGDAAAQNKLGDSYVKGEGVPQDFQLADSWFRKAAEQGLAAAQYNLAVSYANGEGVAKDLQQAASWFRKAAEQGHATAQFNLAVSYVNGEGVAKDYQQAVSWCRKAAEQGFAPAQFNLAVSYARGDGVSKDANQAVSWYRKAAEQGYADAQYALAVSYAKGEGVTQNSQQMASWLRKAAEQGNATAQYALGVAYTKGEGVSQDAKQAVFWFRKAAEQGNTAAQSSLARIELKGIESANDVKFSGGLSEALANNKDKGLDWFKNKAFKLDKVSNISMCDPGICYIFGFNGTLPLGITQEKEDFNGRRLQGQFVRVVGTDRFGTIVVTRLTINEKVSQKTSLASSEKLAKNPSPASPATSNYAEIVNSIDDLIIGRVVESWARPPSARNGMVVVLQVEMVQDGTMRSVNVAKSSGDVPYDNSVVAAVKSIGRLSEMQELKPSDFQPYRSFKLTFTPEDLTL